jgi:teichuronic acid exporter
MEGDSKYAHVKTKRASAALIGAFWSAINAVVPTTLNSVVFIVSSRYLLPHDFGVIALALSLVSFASAIAPAALGEALIQQFNVRKSHLDSVFWICVGSAVIIYGILVLTAPILATTVNQPEVTKFLPLLGLKLLFDLAAVVPNALVARAMSFHLIALRTVVATLISSIICISLLLHGYGIWALAISQLAVSVASCIGVFWGAKWWPGFNFGIKELKDLRKYGVFASANRFIQFMNLDQIIIGSLIGTAPLGIYNFAKRLFQMLNDVIAGALTSVSHALLSSLQNENEKVREAFLITTFASSIVSFPAFIGLALVVDDAIPLIFGAQWIEAISPTRWFCLIGLMSCIGIIQASLINSQGKSNWWFYYQLFRQVLTISTLFILFNKGVNFIVMVMALQTVILWPMTLVMVSKIINIEITAYFRQFIEPFLASAIMTFVVLLISYFMPEYSQKLRLLAEVAFGGIAYCISIYFLTKEKLFGIIKTVLNSRKARQLSA